MKARANGNWTEAAGFWALALPAIAALVLVCPSVNWAGSQGSRRSAPTAKSAPASAAKQSVAAKPRPKGLNTGITVHGWWKIDVRNPDGRLVKHVEFENSLDGGFNFPAGSGTVAINGGAAYLTGMLTGQFSQPASDMAVLLGNISNDQSETPTEVAFVAGGSAPCQPTLNNWGFLGTSSTAIGACVIAGAGASLFCPSQAGPGVSCNLAVNPAGGSPSASFVLTGAVVATQSGTIGAVATMVPVLGNLFTFTSSTNFPGAPLTVSSGQLINVSVAISFQ